MGAVSLTHGIASGDKVTMSANRVDFGGQAIPLLETTLGGLRTTVFIHDIERAQRMADDLAQVAQDLQDVVDGIRFPKVDG